MLTERIGGKTGATCLPDVVAEQVDVEKLGSKSQAAYAYVRKTGLDLNFA